MKSVEEEIPVILKKAAGADGIPSKFSFLFWLLRIQIISNKKIII